MLPRKAPAADHGALFAPKAGILPSVHLPDVLSPGLPGIFHPTGLHHDQPSLPPPSLPVAPGGMGIAHGEQLLHGSEARRLWLLPRWGQRVTSN